MEDISNGRAWFVGEVKVETDGRMCQVWVRVRAKRAQLHRFQGLLPESQGHNLALTVLYVPYSLISGTQNFTGVGRN